MFCSKCGKTVEFDAVTCPSCGAPLGENRFGGAQDYTSVQFTIAPGQTDFEADQSRQTEPVKPYTRTSYTNMEDAEQEDAPLESRTTYRPEFGISSVSKKVRRDMEDTFDKIERRKAGLPDDKADEEPAEEDTLERPEAYDLSAEDIPLSEASREKMGEIEKDLDERVAIDRDELRARPIELAGKAGISEDVSEYIRKMEDEDTGRRSVKARRSTPVYDDYASSDDADDRSAGAVSRRARKQKPADEDLYDDEEFYDDEYDDEEAEGGANIAGIIKIAIAVIVLAALVFGVVKWVGHIRGSQSAAPIEGVTETYYDSALEMIKGRVDPAYIEDRTSLYVNSGLLSFTNAMNEDTAAIKALMPEEPAANDKTFETALLKIQDNISSTILMDGLDQENGTGSSAESEERWSIVNNSVIQLESARSAAELTAITNGETIEVVTETPEPTVQPVNYGTLQKGDESNEVYRLQNRLYDLGFLKDTRDGAFGSKTQTAVKLFQEAAGIEATGIADPVTQQRLYADDAPYAKGAVTPTPNNGATPVPIADPALSQNEEAAEEEIIEDEGLEEDIEDEIPEGAEEI